MAYETGTASDYRDLLEKIKIFISTNATLVGLGQEWTIHEFEQGTAIRHITNEGDATLKNAFDRQVETYWEILEAGGWVSVEFPTAVAISYFNITAAVSSNYGPTDFDLQYSDDGANWITVKSYADVSWATYPLTHVFTTDVLVSETHAYWRFINTGSKEGVYIAKMSLYEFGDTGYATDLAAEDILIAEGPGISGTDEIFVGFKTYSDADSDYYNIAFNAFTGYVPGHDFDAQPGRHTDNHMIPLWNHPVTYYIRANGQSISVLCKIETVYVMLHAGKFFQYATPVQYPLPLVLCGMYPSESALRYSDASLEVMLKTHVSIRFVDGLWKSVEAYPHYNHVHVPLIAAPYSPYYLPWRDMVGTYPAIPIVLSDADGVYGEIDALYFVSGFNNAVENTVTLGGDTHVVWRNLEATGFSDYYSLELT